MTPKELITQIQRQADTKAKRSHITASDVSRVVSLTFEVLAGLKSDEAFKTVAALITNGQKRREKNKKVKKSEK